MYKVFYYIILGYTNDQVSTTLQYRTANITNFTFLSGSSANYAFGYHHTVLLANLSYDTVYLYRVGDINDGFSDIQAVKTSIESGSNKTFKIAIVGDVGINNSENTINRLLKNYTSYEFLWHLGDIAYADVGLESNYEDKWNTYMDRISLLAANKSYMVLPGNHEATCNEVFPFICDDNLSNFTAYRFRFRMPFDNSSTQSSMWYSFDYGMVHFISFNSETDYPDAPENPGTFLDAGSFGDLMNWIKDDLARASTNRANVPWVVVGAHRPIYSSYYASTYPNSLSDALEPLLLQYDVDFYFAGHVHWYERLYPIGNGGVLSNSYLNPETPIYIINGSGGSIEGHSTGSLDTRNSVAYINKDNYGYGYLNFINRTHAEWSWYRAEDGTEADYVLVVQESHK